MNIMQQSLRLSFFKAHSCGTRIIPHGSEIIKFIFGRKVISVAQSLATFDELIVVLEQDHISSIIPRIQVLRMVMTIIEIHKMQIVGSILQILHGLSDLCDILIGNSICKAVIPSEITGSQQSSEGHK